MNFSIYVALGAVFILLLAAGCTQGPGTGTSTQGRAVFTVADAAADMGTVTSVKVTMDRLEAQRADGAWVTVTTTSRTYDLMQLKLSGSQSLLADVNLEAGTYKQVRMHISQVMVTDSSGDHVAKLPSSELKIMGNFTVTANSTSVVNFDFLADQSLHVTGNGQYILAPVVRMQGRENAQVDTSSNEHVKVMGGMMKTNMLVGMDEDGNVGEGHRIATGLNLTIREDGKILNLPIARNDGNGNSNAGSNGKGRVVVGITDAAANMGNVSSVRLTVNSVQAHSAANGWVTLTNTPKTYDLLALKAAGSMSLMADTNVTPGNYDQMWLEISNVMVTDLTGTHAAKLPSGTLRIMSDAKVSADQTTTLSFDFKVDQSLHMTGNGQYILAPVVTVESRDNAQVDARDETHLRIMGGAVRSNSEVGMDVEGNVGVNARIPDDANVSIDSDNVIRIHNPSVVNGSEKGIQTNDGANPKIGGNVSTGGSITPPARAASYCSGKDGPQLVNCTVGVAIEAKDVNVCTTLSDHEALNTCITTWCAAVRNYTSCYAIANNDDQLLCISRCNPNRNQ